MFMGSNAERVEDDVDGGAVGQGMHVRLGEIREITPLLPWRAGELVALRDLPLRRHEHAHQAVHAGRQVVAVFAVEGDDVDDDAALAVRHL